MVAEPARPVSPVDFTAGVASNAWVNSDYRHLILDAGHVPSALAARPGQFFHLVCPAAGSDAPYLRRPFSIYRVDGGNARLEFLYRVAGAGTRGLASLVPGDRIDLLGPLGCGFEVAAAAHVLVLARGVGLATLAPLAEAAGKRGARTTAILSARSRDLIMSADYLEQAGATVHVVDDASGTSGVDRVEALVRTIHAAQPIAYAATCGSNRLLLLLRRLREEIGFRGQVALEQQMACGIGSCFCCVRGFAAGGTTTYRRVCVDGPVFDLREVTSW